MRNYSIKKEQIIMVRNSITFLLLVRFDSFNRLENLLCTVDLIKNEFKFDAFILEVGERYNQGLEKFLKDIKYKFICDPDPILHRTFYLNKMTMESKTPFIGIWDADIIISPEQVYKALSLLEAGEAEFVFPYEKPFLDTTSIIRKLFLEDKKIETLEQNKNKMIEMYGPDPLGGAFMVNRKAYINAGMENEEFYGWGMEDGERYYRMQKAGLRIRRVPGPLYHLTHSRGINSDFHNEDQGLFKQKETLLAKRLLGGSYPDLR
jgi:hypothetical protein